jgi:hypothetical protein
MIASREGALPLLPQLLTSNPPAIPTAHDKDGNTALHYASASGELKALRLLLQFGASPLAENAYSWTPVAYSATTAAEAYFKQLVAEFERRRLDALKLEREMEMQRFAGVRLVTGVPGATGGEMGSPGMRVVTAVGAEEFPQPPGSSAGRAASAAGLRPREGSLSGVTPVGVDWSPVTPDERKAMTPTETKGGWNFSVPTRGRAASGD